MKNTIWVKAAPGRVLTFPSGVPNLAGARLAGEMPAIEKHGTPATPADPAVRIDLGAMAEGTAARLRTFLRKRELAGDCVITAADPPNLAAPRAATTAKE